MLVKYQMSFLLYEKKDIDYTEVFSGCLKYVMNRK